MTGENVTGNDGKTWFWKTIKERYPTNIKGWWYNLCRLERPLARQSATSVNKNGEVKSAFSVKNVIWQKITISPKQKAIYIFGIFSFKIITISSSNVFFFYFTLLKNRNITGKCLWKIVIMRFLNLQKMLVY